MTLYYLQNGQEVELIERLSNGDYLVLELLDEPYDEGGQVPGNKIIVNKVYVEAPKKRFNDKIAELQAKIEELEMKRRTIAQDIANRAVEGQALVEKYGKITQLKELNNFIDGKITHIFVGGWTKKIETFQDALTSPDHKELRLLSLFGDTKGDLRWRVNWYRDGSGSWQDCMPCTSYEEARQHAQKFIDDHIAKERSVYDSLVELAKDHDLYIHPDYLEARRNEKRVAMKNDIEKKLQELAAREQELREFDDQ